MRRLVENIRLLHGIQRCTHGKITESRLPCEIAVAGVDFLDPDGGSSLEALDELWDGPFEREVAQNVHMVVRATHHDSRATELQGHCRDEMVDFGNVLGPHFYISHMINEVTVVLMIGMAHDTAIVP